MLTGRVAPRLLLLVAPLAAVAACASSGGTGEVRSERPVDQGAGTPERAASTRMTERGLALLEEGSAERAAAVLERAVRVDPSHGAAYLALARARLALGEAEQALGLLERAEGLLRAHPEAAARADSLRAVIRDAGEG